jgi:2-amino-4-hydroxy-6-hydroxymethyldihydropteridine diphosphokinase
VIHAVVGLGTNLGDRLGELRAAVRRLAKATTVERMSPVYETAPVGGVEQGPFLNAAVLVSYDGDAESLLELLLAIELAAGRVRTVRNGPRTIDLDILYIEDVALESERLTVPHPRLVERGFALRPLVDLLPDAVDPGTRVSYRRLADMNRDEVTRTPYDLIDAS